MQRWMNSPSPIRRVRCFYSDRPRGKIQSQDLIDVVVYRGSDTLYGWVFDGLQALGLKLGAIAPVALPGAAGWLALGRVQEHRAALTHWRTAPRPSDKTHRHSSAPQ
jgi:ATP:ADP antiporter, AAA family